MKYLAEIGVWLHVIPLCILAGFAAQSHPIWAVVLAVLVMGGLALILIQKEGLHG